MSDDELIEAMARAMCATDYKQQAIEENVATYNGHAKAALAVCRPIIEAQERERCIGIAEKNSDASGLYIAAAIRETGDE